MPGGGAARAIARDCAVGGVLGVVAATYVASWPPKIGADATWFLVHSVRVLHGDRPYLDFWSIYSPGAWFLMAAAFAAFGANVAVGVAVMAAVHAVIAVGIYGAARALGVRPALAGLAALGHVAVCFPSFDHASSHWFGTLASLAVLGVALGDPTLRARRTPILLGGALAAFLVLEHHRAIAFVPVAAAMAMLAARLAPRGAGRAPGAWSVAGRLAATLAVGVLATFGPVVLRAGWRPVVDHLLLAPLAHYYDASVNRFWTAADVDASGYDETIAACVRVLPAALAVTALALVVARRGDATRWWRRAWLLALGVAAVGSVAYNPTPARMALIGAFGLVAAADGVESVAAAVERRLPRARRVPVAVLAAAAFVALGQQARTTAAGPRRRLGHEADTAFGRVAFGGERRASAAKLLRAQLRADGADVLFAYPECSQWDLYVGARNPTPLDSTLASFPSPADLREVVDTLARERVRWVLLCPLFAGPGDDPVMRYVRAAYEPVDLGPLMPIDLRLYRRRGS